MIIQFNKNAFNFGGWITWKSVANASNFVTSNNAFSFTRYDKIKKFKHISLH